MAHKDSSIYSLALHSKSVTPCPRSPTSKVGPCGWAALKPPHRVHVGNAESGPTRDLLSRNLRFSQIPRVLVSTQMSFG